MVVGDLNDFPVSPTVDLRTRQGGLRALIDTLPRAERYSYVFDATPRRWTTCWSAGSLGRVDHDVVRINSEFADQAGDHDPQVARIRLR